MLERREAEGPVLSDEDLALTRALGLPTFEHVGLTLLKRHTLVIRAATIEHVFYPVFPSDRDAGASPGLASRLIDGPLGSELAPGPDRTSARRDPCGPPRRPGWQPCIFGGARVLVATLVAPPLASSTPGVELAAGVVIALSACRPRTARRRPDLGRPRVALVGRQRRAGHGGRRPGRRGHLGDDRRVRPRRTGASSSGRTAIEADGGRGLLRSA